MTTALAPAPERALGADPHGFAALYIRHRSSFTAHARRYLRDPRDADEVVQEAFLRLFLAMPELETELQALAYCRRTITNLCIDRYRADARRPRLVTLEGAPVDELAEDDSGDPVVRAEDAALVREALSQLPELHRAALVKREIEEKPLPVIADELDVAEDSVKHLLFRARRSLRKLLAGTSVAPGVDAELTRGLRPAARGASGGVAGLLLLALLGLGSGPDLRAVPVVGVDLPDVLGVTAVADAVGGAVRDVVEAIAPGSTSEARATAADVPSGPASRPEPLLTAASLQVPVAPAAGGTGAAAVPAARYPGAVAPAGSPRTTTVVTVVDGRPVVTVVPASPELPPAYVPGAGPRTTTPATSAGRGGGPYLPTPAGPAVPTVGREVPATSPVGSAVPGADLPARPVVPAGSGTAPGAPRAEAVVQDKAADVAAKAADKAADAAAKADKTAEKTAVKVEKAAEVSAEKAADVAEKAQEKADKTADKTVQKASQAADKAEKAADKQVGKSNEKAAKAPAAPAPAVGPASVPVPTP